MMRGAAAATTIGRPLEKFVRLGRTPRIRNGADRCAWQRVRCEERALASSAGVLHGSSHRSTTWRFTSKSTIALSVAATSAFWWQSSGACDAETPATSSSSEELSTPTKDEIAGIRAAISAILDEREELGVSFIGLAWTTCASFDDKAQTGGSDDGLVVAAVMQGSAFAEATEELRKVQGLFPTISTGDLCTLAGAIAIEHIGGPYVTWRPGRTGTRGIGGANSERTEAGTPEGQNDLFACKGMPPRGSSNTVMRDTVKNVREVFASQGCSDREAVALMGAYAMLQSSASRDSGDGGWSSTPVIFSNEYFQSLVENTWTLKADEPADVFENAAGDRIMSASDMALLWDRSLRNEVEAMARDEDLFYESFAQAFRKVSENGVAAFAHRVKKAWYQFW